MNNLLNLLSYIIITGVTPIRAHPSNFDFNSFQMSVAPNVFTTEQKISRENAQVFDRQSRGTSQKIQICRVTAEQMQNTDKRSDL